MNRFDDADYFSVRAAEERTLSLSSQDKRVFAAHAEMAERCGQLADKFPARRSRLHIAATTGAVAS